jgi:hypothetical protein
VWNYWLGGKDYFDADREFAEKIVEVYPEIVVLAREGRAFLGRTVRYLAGQVGIRQFLDVGTGLPTVDNTHEVAQRVAPDSRVVYVDNDPLVLAHARALLVGTREGVTAYVDADVHSPQEILAAAGETLDFRRPVGLTLMGIMGNVADLDEAYTIVGQLMAALPHGSYLALRDSTPVRDPARMQAVRELLEEHGFPYRPRTADQIGGFFDGLELVEPGRVSTPLWRPEPGRPAAAIDDLGGVARKP